MPGQKFIKFLRCFFFGKFYTSKSQSEINWPLVPNFIGSAVIKRNELKGGNKIVLALISTKVWIWKQQHAWISLFCWLTLWTSIAYDCYIHIWFFLSFFSGWIVYISCYFNSLATLNSIWASWWNWPSTPTLPCKLNDECWFFFSLGKTRFPLLLQLILLSAISPERF